VLKIRKRKIFEELERHWFFVKFFIPFIVSILVFLLAMYFDSRILIALPFFLISALFSFFGSSLHLLVDTFEDFLVLISHLSSFFKKLTRRKRC
jgi:hypothetical protein